MGGASGAEISQPPGVPRYGRRARAGLVLGHPGGRVTALDSPAASRFPAVKIETVGVEVAFHGRRRL